MSDLADVRAVLLDVDGTLYHQKPLRRRMLQELLWLPLRGPVRALRTIKVIKAYREVLEQLRGESVMRAGASTLEEQQFSRTAERTGVDVETARSIIQEWMEQRPLKYLAPLRRSGLDELLDFASKRGWPIGVFSDYPTRDKVAALGLTDRVSLQLCGLDAEVGALKPDPRGFEVACERWQLAPQNVLYVGDRQELDGVGATAAGLPNVVFGNGCSGFLELLMRLKEVCP